MQRTGLMALTLIVAAGLGACATSQPVKIDISTAAEIPASRAVGLLNGYAVPAEAKRLMAKNEKLEAAIAKYRCTFGEKETLVHATGETLPNSALGFNATSVTGAGIVGQQDGITASVRAPPGKTYFGPGNVPRHCIVGFFPEEFSLQAVQGELNRLATATTAIGIKQGE